MKIILVDFGIMGSISPRERKGLAEIFHAFLTRNYDKVAKLHIKLGYIPYNSNLALFAQACRSIGEPILTQPENRISIANLLSQLFKVTEDFAMETQPQLLLLQKSILIIEGLGQALIAAPWIEEWAKDNLSLEARLKNFAKKIIKRILERIDDQNY